MKAMNIIKAYYDRILDIFMEEYGDIIRSAQPGHCMKVTGFPMEVLHNLYGRLKQIKTDTQVYILSEEPNHTGNVYITPTKLIELRNDLTISILALIPVNSSTTAEDSYGNATFQNLGISEFDNIMYGKLQEEVKAFSAVKNILSYADKALKVTLQDKINYLLYVTLSESKEQAIGNGLYLLGMMPDNSIVSKKEYIAQFLSKNDDCTIVISDYSQAIADRISSLPVKADTIQGEVAKFLHENISIANRKGLCEKIYASYPNLNFSNWYGHLTNIIDLGMLHVTKVDLLGNNFKVEEGDLRLKMDSKKGAKVKLRIYFTPKPNAYEQLKRVRISLMNGDGFYKETDVVIKKVTANNKEYRDIAFTLDNSFNAGTYFFHVFAEDNDGTELNIKDMFRDEAVQAAWEKEENKSFGLSKEDFQQQNRRLLTSDSDTFFLKVIDDGTKRMQKRQEPE